MEAQLTTNPIPLFILLPILIIVAVGTGWLIVKTRINLWKRLVLAVGGIFALFGFAILLFVVYYHVSHTFAGTFKFYAYSALAPDGDPFEKSNVDSQPVIMMRDVASSDGAVRLLYHPNPESPIIVYLFTQGKYITADLQDDALTIPDTKPGSLPRVINTSLWWALTKNIYNETSSVE